MEYYLKLSHEEAQKMLPYGVICETRYGSRWNTLRRRRRWEKEFSASERQAATRIFRQSYRYCLVTGLPDSVKMTAQTAILWRKLANFCASL